ncbi:MAG: hypothetical protein CM1200mP30_26830 [Pseudomonadota bacterium]|nr:MAG: hypothetical protein CM1200mP30_26830 [Pseudomonadota bacterium]
MAVTGKTEDGTESKERWVPVSLLMGHLLPVMRLCPIILCL